MFLFHVISQNGPRAFLGWVSVSIPDRRSTYRNSSESTRQHVTAEAIVGWEGFVAKEINTLAFLVAPRAGQSSLQGRSHAGIHNTKYPAEPGPGTKKKNCHLVAQGTPSHVSPDRSDKRIGRSVFGGAPPTRTPRRNHREPAEEPLTRIPPPRPVREPP